MSSSISIGFVFEKHQNEKEEFSKLLTSLVSNGKLEKLIYSIDENGNDWKEEAKINYPIDIISSIMIENYFGKLTMEATILTSKNINFDVSISNFIQGDFGFLIEIDIEQLFKVGHKEDIKKCTEEIIQFCEKLFDKIKYKYSFCDHEVAIEYTWDEFKKMNDRIYSVSIIPKEKEFIVNLATWDIDGLSNRNE